MVRDHGQAQKYYHEIEGYNGRLDAIQAAFLRVKLAYLNRWNAQRREAAARYRELLAPLQSSGCLVLPYEPEWTQAVYHLYVVRTADRDGLLRQLGANHVQAGLHYPVPLHMQTCYSAWGYGAGSLPVTERVAAEIVSLPMFPGITAEHQEHVAKVLGAAVHAPTI
jgi:dTDP-4-amino-4,6-dideoxygalactose transaminase